MGSRLARLIVGHPRAVLLAAFAVALASAPVVMRLRLDANVTAMVPGAERSAAAYARYAELFAAEQSLVVVVECDDAARLTGFADRLAEKLRARAEVAEVRERLSAQSADLIRRHLVQLLDEDEIDALAPRVTDEALRAQARRLRALLSAPGGGALQEMVKADPLELLPSVGARLQAGLPVDPTSGYFKSADGKALVILLRLNFGAWEFERTRALLAAVAADARALGATVPEDGALAASAQPSVGFTGAYAYALAYRDALHRDVTVSTIVSVAAVLIFFALLLGALRAIPLVAVPLLYGLWLTGAAAVLLYGRVNAVSLSFGTLLVSIGIDLPIQLYNRLREEMGEHPPLVALERTVGRLAGPALLATLGPAAVFFCCALSDYRGLAELGILAGVGLILNLVAMLTVLPALLALVPPSLWAPPRPRTDGRWFAAFGRFTARRPRAVLAVVALVIAGAVPLALRLPFERRLISIEPPGMPVVRVQREVEARFGERQHLIIAMAEDADPERALEKADAFRAAAERLRKGGKITAYESVSTLFPSRAEQARRRERLARLDPARVARALRAALDEAGFDAAAFAPFLDQLERPPPPITLADAGPELSFLIHNTVHDAPGRRTVVTYLFTRPSEVEAVAAALDHLAPSPGVVTGQPILESALRRVVVRDTARVTGASVLAVAMLLLLYYRRPRPVIAVMLPLTAAWVLFAAVLGATGTPINLFNLLAVPLVVGYGIDDHVFLLHRYVEDPARGPERALASTGRAIVVTSLSTMAGFAGLAVARFPGLRSLGVAGALAVGLCLLAAMAVLPALLALLWPPRR